MAAEVWFASKSSTPRKSCWWGHCGEFSQNQLLPAKVFPKTKKQKNARTASEHVFEVLGSLKAKGRRASAGENVPTFEDLQRLLRALLGRFLWEAEVSEKLKNQECQLWTERISSSPGYGPRI